ncbi:MAG: DUF4198 domain-containing protein [Rhodocyclales bacterium]|nr:DUF4198 domain-containing protein [Rhodocyclales bacterium]
MKIGMRLIVAALALASAAPGWAHGIWFAQRSGRLALIYGEGAEDVDVFKRLHKITAVGGADAAGRPVAVRLKAVDPMLFVDAEQAPAVVTATMDNGFWSRQPSGQWVAKPRDEVPGATAAGRYLKYATHLAVLPDTEVGPAPGQAFQIVPVGAGFPRQKGQPLTVRVLYDGKPLAGARVWPDAVTDPDAVPLSTGADGTATLAVRNQGLNVVKAEHVSGSDDPARSDKTEHVATLSFMLGHAPE